MTLLLFIAVAFLAYATGANDNFKGVASLFGSGTTTYNTALAWATVTTFAGSLCSIFLAQGLLKTFSGKGLVPDALVSSESFLLAIAPGAGLTVILTTRLGFPISTTHSLTGGILGSGVVAVGGRVAFALLGRQFFLPLSPAQDRAESVSELTQGPLVGELGGVCASFAVPVACGVTRGHGRVEVALGFLFRSPQFQSGRAHDDIHGFAARHESSCTYPLRSMSCLPHSFDSKVCRPAT